MAGGRSGLSRRLSNVKTAPVTAVVRKTVGRMATLDAVAEQANVPLNQLMDDVAGEIEARTGARPAIRALEGQRRLLD